MLDFGFGLKLMKTNYKYNGHGITIPKNIASSATKIATAAQKEAPAVAKSTIEGNLATMDEIIKNLTIKRDAMNKCYSLTGMI